MLTPIVKDVKVIEPYKILLTFENGEKKIYDMEPNLKYECFKRLENYEKFKKVHPRKVTVEWEDGEDINPDDLYYNSIKVEE